MHLKVEKTLALSSQSIRVPDSSKPGLLTGKIDVPNLIKSDETENYFPFVLCSGKEIRSIFIMS
jgi:hypothetical protein